MCLAVTYAIKSNENHGYKILEKVGNKYFTGISNARLVEIPTTKYARTPKKLNPTHFTGYSKSKYEQAFHICTRKEEALTILPLEKANTNMRDLVVCEVIYAEEVAFGETHWHFLEDPARRRYTETVVARKCRVIQEVA